MKKPGILALITFFAVVISGALLVPLLPVLDPGKFGEKMFYVALISSITVYFAARSFLKPKDK